MAASKLLLACRVLSCTPRCCVLGRYHCNVDIGESAVKWKTIKDLGIDMEKIELRYGHHTGAASIQHALVGMEVLHA